MLSENIRFSVGDKVCGKPDARQTPLAIIVVGMLEAWFQALLRII